MSHDSLGGADTGLLFLILAIIGVFLPVLPTVPFLILTAWFAARGSDRLHSWLYAHPRLGKLLIDWERQGAVSRTSKVFSVLALIVSWVVMYYRINEAWMMAAITILFVSVSAYVLSRPTPKPDM